MNANKTKLKSLDAIGSDPRVHEITRDNYGDSPTNRMTLETGYHLEVAGVHYISGTVAELKAAANNIDVCECERCAEEIKHER